jgi:multidrug efflux pump subunit AcrA (membrane-fusion protein)
MAQAAEVLEDRLAIGGNNPPEEFALLKDEVDKFLATADLWLAERPKIESADMAARAEDFDTQLRALEKKISGMEEAEKRPLMTALDEVRTRFKKLSGLVGDVRKLFKARREAWLLAEQKRIDEERRQAEEKARLAREEAERKRQEAEEAAALADKGALKGSEVSITRALADAQEAEEAAALADADLDAAASAKAQVRGDQTGGKATTLKTVYRGEIVDNGKLLAWVKKNRADELMGFLQKYADTYARSPELRKQGLPGVEFKAEQRL